MVARTSSKKKAATRVGTPARKKPAATKAGGAKKAGSAKAAQKRAGAKRAEKRTATKATARKPVATKRPSTDVKTKPTSASVAAFLDRLEPARREECRTLVALMSRVTGEAPTMWGSSIVGFGSVRYRTANGREGDWFATGFSPRKNALTVYVMAGFETQKEKLARLGKHSLGKACLYLRSLEDIDLGVLEAIVATSLNEWCTRAPAVDG